MNEGLTDSELLRAFTRRADQQAFAVLVGRHLDLVYGTAMRQAEDREAAKEITQNVFTALSRKSWQFAPDDSLPAWLHRTALLEAKYWLRGELRRRRREQLAAELGTTMKSHNEQSALRELIPLIDEALLSLREKDRSALLLRYYEGRSLREVGTSLGVGEDAAQKRVANALDRLARFFQRRGFKTVSGTLAAATLQQTALSAPSSLASAAAQTAVQSVPASAIGITAWLSRIASLTKAQTATLCLALAAVPLAWQWNQTHAAVRDAALAQSRLEVARLAEANATARNKTLRAEAARLDAILAARASEQAANEPVIEEWNAWSERIRALLAEPDYRWQDDLPYVRIPKAILPKLDLMSMFRQSGTLSEPATEVLAITPEERSVAEQALGNYWKGVLDQMSARAYETNLATAPSEHLAKTVIVPPLGQDLKSLAQNTQERLINLLGADREKMLFGGWDEGAIQIFWPGNLWKISENAQEFKVWVYPRASSDGSPRFGSSWKFQNGSTSTEGSLRVLPQAIAAQYFMPWLRDLGIQDSTLFPGQ